MSRDTDAESVDVMVERMLASTCTNDAVEGGCSCVLLVQSAERLRALVEERDELQAKYDALVEAARRLADLTRDHQLLCHRALCLPDADCEQPRYSDRVKNVAAKVAALLPEEPETR